MTPSPGAIWQDLECGGYTADLGLWDELASEAGGPVLDLGCGVGRVALHLGRRGHPVAGLDLDPELVAAFNERAAAEGLEARAASGDARDFELGES
jgi:cyclopropane fatty-acyl-phospholipid synthase-like methyltransferase